MLKRYSNLRSVSKYIALFWMFCLILQLLLQGYIHDFYWVSGLWLFASLVLIGLFNEILKNSTEFSFRMTTILVSIFWGLLLIFISSYLLEMYRGIPFVALDDVVYNDQQIEISHKLNSGRLNFKDSLMEGFYSGYPNLGGILMYFFGQHWIVPRIFTVILFSVSSTYFYNICLHFFNLRIARFTYLIYLFSPIFVYYAIFQLKDILIVILLLVSFESILKLSNGRSVVGNLLKITFCMVALIPIRGMVIVTFLLTALMFSLIKKSSIIGKTYSSIILLLLCVLIFFGWNYLANLGLFMSPETYFDIRFNLLGDTEVMQGSKSVVSASNLAYLVSAPLFILLSPFVPIPTALMFENPDYPSLNSEFSSNIMLYALIPFFITGIIIWIKSKSYKELWLFVIFYLIYKIGSAVSGMTLWSFRQSLPSILVMMFIIPLSFQNGIPLKNSKWTIFLLLLLCFTWSTFRFYIRS